MAGVDEPLLFVCPVGEPLRLYCRVDWPLPIYSPQTDSGGYLQLAAIGYLRLAPHPIHNVLEAFLNNLPCLPATTSLQVYRCTDTNACA